jgi:hypothetical protein
LGDASAREIRIQLTSVSRPNWQNFLLLETDLTHARIGQQIGISQKNGFRV